jgi:hypothetical protein
MLKVPAAAEYNGDTSSEKLTGVSRQVSARLATKFVCWWMNQKLLELRWGRKIDQEIAAVHETLCTIPPRNSNN